MVVSPMLLVAVSLVLGADAGEEATKKDMAAFQGEWKVLKLEIAGEKKEDGPRVFFEGDKILMEMDGAKKEIATFKLDASVSPKFMDVKPGEGDLLEGIYKLEDNKLSLAFVKKGEARPADFAGTPTNIVASLEKAK